MATRTANDLAEAVYHLLATDCYGPYTALDAALPVHQQSDDASRTVHELDYIDFGLTVGLAYGIARGEDPYESGKSVVDRSTQAATLAYERWGNWNVTFAQDRAARPVPSNYSEAVA